MTTDIIIPFYDHAQTLGVCLASVTSSIDLSLAAVTVVDDSIDPQERQACAGLCAQNGVRLLVNETNLGFDGATKRGAAETDGEFILFLNSDTQALEWGWLDHMLAAFADLKVAIVGAKLLFPDGRIQHAGIARTDGGFVFHPFAGEPESYPPANVFRDDLNAVTGGCLLIRRGVWDELGGWDEKFGKGVFEDCDLGWRARAAGYRVAYTPKAALVHLQSQGTPQNQHPLHSISGPNGAYLRAKHSGIKSDEPLFGLPERTEAEAQGAVPDGAQVAVQFSPELSAQILPLVQAAQGGNPWAQSVMKDLVAAPNQAMRDEMARAFLDLCYAVAKVNKRLLQRQAGGPVKNVYTSLPDDLPPALRVAQAKVKAWEQKQAHHRRKGGNHE